MLGKWRRKLKKEPLSVYVILVAPQFYLLFPFCYAKIAEILATHDQLFWPRLYTRFIVTLRDKLSQPTCLVQTSPVFFHHLL